MTNRTRLIVIAIISAFTLVPAATASARSVQTGAATAVTSTSATLTAQVDPGGSDDFFRFEYFAGSTQINTPWVGLPSGGMRPVSAAITGLTADTAYRFRVVVADSDDWAPGAMATFRTAVVAPVTPTPTTPLPTPVPPQSPPAPQPVVGDTVVVAPSAGTVKVKAPGGGYTTLQAGDDIPVGSLVDTRGGTVQLTSAVAPGVTQTGEFRGALFEIRQSANGMTDLVLRGAELSSCGRTTARSAARRRPPVRRLWGSDSNGKFRTHGRHSVATVRGTKWVTTETCAGTRTTVTEGAVSVRDKRLRKSVLVRAGQSYLARAR